MNLVLFFFKYFLPLAPEGDLFFCYARMKSIFFYFLLDTNICKAFHSVDFNILAHRIRSTGDKIDSRVSTVIIRHFHPA